MFYVNMVDRFMSGWGDASRGRSLYSVKCATRYQADCIQKAAEDRSEMKYVAISGNPPRKRAGDHLKVVGFEDVSGPWKKYYSAAHDTLS